MNILGNIIEFDHWLFHLINFEWSNGFFDVILPFWRDKENWIPLYIIFIIISIFKYNKRFWLHLLFVLITIAGSDTISSKIIKPSIKRERPCRTFEIEDIKLLRNCGGGYSFTSSHATNHMAIATFLAFSLFTLSSFKYILFLWAFIVGYAQIYVGVHYPGDVFFGFIIGIIVGFLTNYLFDKIYKKLFLG